MLEAELVLSVLVARSQREGECGPAIEHAALGLPGLLTYGLGVNVRVSVCTLGCIL